jgi:hypothetical protein
MPRFCAFRQSLANAWQVRWPAVSVALLVAAIGASVAGRREGIHLAVHSGRSLLVFSIAWDRLTILNETIGDSSISRVWLTPPFYLHVQAPTLFQTAPMLAPFRPICSPSLGCVLGSPYFRQNNLAIRMIQIPNLFLIIGSGLACTLSAYKIRSLFRHGLENRCKNCGYDLRASPGRCPECGGIVEGDQGIESGSEKRKESMVASSDPSAIAPDRSLVSFRSS